VAACGPGPSQTLHCCAEGCSGDRVWGCKGSRSCSGSPVTVPEQQIPRQIQTMLEQMGTAGSDQLVTASSSRSGSGHPLSCSPTGLQPLVWAVSPGHPPRGCWQHPRVHAVLQTGCSPGPSTAEHRQGQAASCNTPAPVHRCGQPLRLLGRAALVPGPRTLWGAAGPGVWLRSEASAQSGQINAGRKMLLCASGFVMEHV